MGWKRHSIGFVYMPILCAENSCVYKAPDRMKQRIVVSSGPLKVTSRTPVEAVLCGADVAVRLPEAFLLDLG